MILMAFSWKSTRLTHAHVQSTTQGHTRPNHVCKYEEHLVSPLNQRLKVEVKRKQVDSRVVCRCGEPCCTVSHKNMHLIESRQAVVHGCQLLKRRSKHTWIRAIMLPVHASPLCQDLACAPGAMAVLSTPDCQEQSKNPTHQHEIGDTEIA